MLFDDHELGPGGIEVRPKLAALPEGTRLVLVPYACNPHGLLKPYWGVASLIDDQGSLEWVTTPEPLPLSATPSRRRLSAVPQRATAPEHVSFDAGEQPVPCCSRGRTWRRSETSPMTEQDPIEPLANEDDED
ncbi:hypothetical protein [Streptomyces sp. NBC_01233]|uniref:hypothetical protein n=1 Tax=Streptomyces sp. NBC_01233 TaxID=2903787 RepID=UPI002E15665F|nr:hypothetical protein OG332_42085 [Streptomyces sp. NBC_01233]